MEAWEQVLEDYYAKYKHNFVVQKMADYPYPWLNYRTPEYQEFIKKEKYVSQREVFYDEIVFDIDMDKELPTKIARLEAKRIALELSQRLRKFGYSHSVWSSGGSGVHIHLFFPELMKFNNLDCVVMKKTFLKIVGEGFLRSPRRKSGVQTQSLVTIQIEHARHRKGGQKKPLDVYTTGNENILSPFFHEAFKKEKMENDLARRYFKEQLKKGKPDAIVFLENEKFLHYKDGRARALFILAAYYKQTMEAEELFNHLMGWNRRVLGGYFQARTIKSTMKSARPGLPISTLVELFDELGLDQKYIAQLRGNRNVTIPNR